MTTTDREKLARQWAEDYQKNYPEFLPESHAAEMVKRAKAAADYILEHTEPEIPELNRWDGVEMDGREWVVRSASKTGKLALIASDGSAYAHDFAENVTPNGKKYELREVTKPDHPEVLKTVEDYENAPEGTIVVTPGEDSMAVQKLDDGKWGIIGVKKLVDAEDCSRASADHGATTVLRWGGEA